MRFDLLQKATEFNKKHKWIKSWHKVLMCLAVIVVFCTTYALILPAITMEKTATCGFEEHTHSEECYAVVPSEKTYTCNLALHTHDVGCYGADGSLMCGYADFVIHSHNAECYAGDGSLLCQLPEVFTHVHGSGCYSVTEAYYQCGMEEGYGAHIHTTECYQTETLICGMEEGIAVNNLNVEEAVETQAVEKDGQNTENVDEPLETEALQVISEHVHDASCYAVSETEICGLDASEGHVHTDECLGEETSTLICGMQELYVHTHGAGCYDASGNRICGLLETYEHIHTEECFTVGESAVDKESNLICGKEEHVHDDQICYLNTNTNADVETAVDWEATLPSQLSGDLRKDIIAVAQSQLGYTESSENVAVTADGRILGYTRYGAWYGDHYGDWCAMFVSFCLNYANVPRYSFPIESNCRRWINALTPMGLYRSATEYSPKPGDVIFFEYDGDNSSDHVGLVYEVSNGKIVTIEGNNSNKVEYFTYDANANFIMGYGVIPGPEVQAEVNYVIQLIDEMPSADEIDAKLAEFESVEDYEGEEEYYMAVCKRVARAYYYYSRLTDQQKEEVTNAEKLLELEYIWSVVTLEVTASPTVYQINHYTSTGVSQTATIMVHGGSVREKLGTSMSYLYWDVVIVEKNNNGGLSVSQIITSDISKLDYKATSADGFLLMFNADTVNVAVGDPVSVNFDYKSISSGAYKSAGYGTVTFGTTAKLKEEKDNTSKLTVVPSADTSDLIEVNLYNYGSNINTLYNTNKNYPGFQQEGGERSGAKTLSSNFGNNVTEDRDAGIASLTNKGGSINTIINAANQPIKDAILKTLGSDQYPALADGTSLKYLFTDNVYAVKRNKQNINGLFQYHPDTGAYTFNSRENHAQFNSSNDTFTLYEQIITPNFTMYPFGNFLPFSDIVHDAAQVSTMDREYIDSIRASALYKSQNGFDNAYSTVTPYATLASSMNTWMGVMDNKYGTNWGIVQGANEYFSEVAAIPDIDFSQNTELIQNTYCIDYDEPKNFYFGMEMKMEFMQPKNGLTGNDGNQPMIFYFTGDDDVWVYIDGVLFLDLSGIHRHVGGEIDFVNGVVKYYVLDPGTGDVTSAPYETVKFSDILGTTDDLNDKGTFKDYSSHTFNFYYMERGAGSGVCRMNFNFPLLRKNSISVEKELTVDEPDKLPLLGNPDFKFQILKANQNGTTTDELFIGGNTSFMVYDLNDNFIRTGTTDANGVFSIKAGERAIFEGIEEDDGKYYVRELLNTKDFDQYGSISVDGATQTTNYDVEVGQDQFTGVNSPVKDVSDGSTLFHFDNEVVFNKLGRLSVSKVLENYSGTNTLSTFDFEVTLDGILLPVNTEYTVTNEDGSKLTKYVETEGIITLEAGQTAEIEKIISGTRFVVKETSASSLGYTVTYSGSEEVTTDGSSAAGVVRQSSTVGVTVTNGEQGTSVTIPGIKTLKNPDSGSHEFVFRLQQVTDSTGSSLVENGEQQEAVITLTDSHPVEFGFTLNYIKRKETKLPVTYYYKITEAADQTLIEQYDYDDSVYIAAIKVFEDGNEIKAELDSVWKDGIKLTDVPLQTEFTNRLLKNLSISKTVKGIEVTDKMAFEFELMLKDGEQPLIGTFKVTKSDGSISDVVFDSDGKTTIILKPDETLMIHALPYGAAWSVIEINTDGYVVSTQTGTNEIIFGSTVNGKLKEGSDSIRFINESTYELPETGGSGTNLYTIGGILLIVIAGGLLWYKQKKRGKEEWASF